MDKISSALIYDRVKKIYGDRETVERNTRYAIRTMVLWGFLKDCPERHGWYLRGEELQVTNPRVVALLLESVLLANSEGRQSIDALNRSIGLFSFSFEYMTAGILKALSGGRLSSSEYDMSNTIMYLANQQCY